MGELEGLQDCPGLNPPEREILVYLVSMVRLVMVHCVNEKARGGLVLADSPTGFIFEPIYFLCQPLF